MLVAAFYRQKMISFSQNCNFLPNIFKCKLQKVNKDLDDKMYMIFYMYKG